MGRQDPGLGTAEYFVDQFCDYIICHPNQRGKGLS